MARKHTAGFEQNTIAPGWVASGSPTIQGTTVRSGSYAGQITSLASGTRKGWTIDEVGAATFTARYYRTYLRVGTFPSTGGPPTENRFFVVTNGTAISSTALVYLTVDNGGLLRLYDEDGQIGSASSALSVDTWYRVEVLVDLSAGSGASTHAITARIDGTDFATASNRAISAGLRSLSLGGNLNAEAQTTGNWYLDDVAFNDTSGTAQASWPGDGGVVILRPTGAGSVTGWTPLSGSNWDNVDEVTPDDATSYVTSTASANVADYYDMGDTPAEIQAGATISVVHVIVKFRGSAAADTNDQFQTAIKKGSGGTENLGTAHNPNSTSWSWRRNSPAAPFIEHTIYTDPDGSAWTKATLDTIQAGLKAGATPDTNRTDVTWLGVVVDYTNAAQAGGSSAGRNLSLLGVG